MISHTTCLKLGLAALAGALILGCNQQSVAQSEPAEPVHVASLRGDVGIANDDPVPDLVSYPRHDQKIPRTFEEQPPLVPHDIDGSKYSVSLDENNCLGCHDKPFYKEEEAPKISESHYLDAHGKEMEQIANNRYFCTQCHVPQSDAAPLVENAFKPVSLTAR